MPKIKDEFISILGVEKIINLDYPKPSRHDVEQAYVLVNTWALLFKEYNLVFAEDLISLLNFHGLREVIRIAQCFAEIVITTLNNGDDSLELGIDFGAPETRRAFAVFRNFASVALTPVHNESAAQLAAKCLQCLRYPKRFAYNDDTSLSDAAVSALLSTNRRIKRINRQGIPYWMEKRLRLIGATILRNFKMAEIATIPRGRIGDAIGANTKAQKAQLLSTRYSLLGDINMHNTDLERGRYPEEFDSRWISVHTRQGYKPTRVYNKLYRIPTKVPRTFCKIVAVPKNYKSARTIGMEEIDRQLVLGRIGDGIRTCLENHKGKYATAGRITINDQSRNQLMSLKASLTGALATVDLSAASDSLSFPIVEAVLGRDIFRLVLPFRSNYLDHGARTLAHIFSTMGSRITFPLECLTFWCILMVARDFLKTFGIDTPLDDYSVYGDDIICPTDAYETVVDLLNICGFIVNDEKSFGHGYFRESCGCEYYKGIDLHSIYWPRRDMNTDATGPLETMVALQHRLYQHQGASTFLERYIKSKKPSICYSEVGDNDAGIWRYAPPIEEVMIIPGNNSGKLFPDHDPCIGLARAEKRTVSTTVYPKTKISDEEQEYADICAYYEFLAFGPSYGSKLDELLRVSEPRDRRAYTHDSTTKLINRLIVD